SKAQMWGQIEAISQVRLKVVAHAIRERQTWGKRPVILCEPCHFPLFKTNAGVSAHYGKLRRSIAGQTQKGPAITFKGTDRNGLTIDEYWITARIAFDVRAESKGAAKVRALDIIGIRSIGAKSKFHLMFVRAVT